MPSRSPSSAGADPPGSRSSATLVAIRTVHSGVFLVELASIAWLLVSGLLGRRDRSVAVAAVLVAGESAVFLANAGVCPLTPLAERHGAERGSVSDIYLPDGLARTIPIWATTLVVAAVVLHAVGVVRQRRGRVHAGTGIGGSPRPTGGRRLGAELLSVDQAG